MYLRIWLYFAIMAATTLLLLWLFQFLFLNYFYYDRQVNEIKRISSELMNYEYGVKEPTNWSKFENVAKKENVNIYLFTMNTDLIHKQGNEYAFPSDTIIRIYTPNITIENAPMNALTWSNVQKDMFLENVIMLDANSSFYYSERELSGSTDANNNIFYGGKLSGDFGINKQCYFCLFATITNEDFTVNIMNTMVLVSSVVILVVSFILSLLFSRQLSRPINRLATTAQQLAKGDFTVKFTTSSNLKEVSSLASSLDFAKEEMSKTEQMRRDFIANISHDLRTPLTMIKAYAEMIRDLSGKNDEKRTKHCQIIIDETNRLSTLVGDIQNLSKLQSGTSEFKATKFDLSALCKTVISRFEIMSETQGYVFVAECEDNAYCYGDFNKIEQVLYNLIGNALNYTGEDKKVTVRCSKANTFYKVEIIDTGKGIEPDQLQKVWERYYRANQKKRSIVGSGLGLNIVKIILEVHEVPYGVISEVNSGTNFWFMLPIENKFASDEENKNNKFAPPEGENKNNKFAPPDDNRNNK